MENKTEKKIIVLSLLIITIFFVGLAFLFTDNGRETAEINQGKIVSVESEKTKKSEPMIESQAIGSREEDSKLGFAWNKKFIKIANNIPANSNHPATRPATTYRHSDDLEFDLNLMLGYVNDENVDYRDEIYARLDYEFATNQMEFTNSDPIEDVVEQFENAIDYALGIDFPLDRRNEIKDKQRDMIKKKALLDDQDDLSRDEYFAKLAMVYENCLHETAEVLTDEEFYSLFQIVKEQINGCFSKIVNNPK